MIERCHPQGYLQIRGGKLGDGKHKQKYLLPRIIPLTTNQLYNGIIYCLLMVLIHRSRYFRMRDTMMVMYKKKSAKGKYGKGSARYLKVCAALCSTPLSPALAKPTRR